MKKSKYRFVILGAGLSGLSTAYELSKAYPGEILIVERDAKAGGLCKTIDRDNASYDLGSHRIHRDAGLGALGLIKDICGDSLIRNSRSGKLRLKKAYINYPLKSLEMFFALGLAESLLCAFSLLKSSMYDLLQENKDREFEQDYSSYLVRKAGSRGYKLFYEPYARKLWGCEPSMISVDAVKKRISTASPLGLLKDMLARYSADNKYNSYYYLRSGIGAIAEGLEQRLIQNDCEVVKNVEDFAINKKGRKTISFTDKGRDFQVEFEVLISTISPAVLINKLTANERALEAASKLNWRSLKLVYLHLAKEPALSGETFYFPELKYAFGRVSVPRRFSSLMQPDNSSNALVCEIPCTQGDPVWNKPDAEIYDLCFKGLKDAGLIDDDKSVMPSKDFIINAPEVYPVYEIGYKRHLLFLFEYLSESFPYIYSSGKLGFFLHCNLDHAIDIGLSLAEHIREGRSSLDWHNKINLFQNMKLRD